MRRCRATARATSTRSISRGQSGADLERVAPRHRPQDPAQRRRHRPLTAPQDLDRVIDNIFVHSNVPPFIATRLIRSLVTSNPSPAYVERVSNVFINNGAGAWRPGGGRPRRPARSWEALTPDATLHGRLKDPVLRHHRLTAP
ncbi:MAG: DUF1800 family protein [Vicinamibacterales bacterium]